MKFLGTLILPVVLLGYSGCKDDDDPSTSEIQKQQLAKLVKTWNISTATLDGMTVTDYYSGFSITISGSDPQSFSYITTGRPHYSSWPAGGTLEFNQTSTSTLVRDEGTDDELLITYALNNNQLEITYTFSGSPYNARGESVTGEWHFTFK